MTLYELVGMKRKNSVLKSVFISKEKGGWSNCHVVVEAYDETFLKNTNTISKQEKTYEYITRVIKENKGLIQGYIGDYSDELVVMHYSTFDNHHQQIVKLG